jgi:hypothetical protein
MFSIIIIFFSCTKEDQKLNMKNSDASIGTEGKFVKEIVVYDENLENSAYFRISSDTEQFLNDYLNSFTLTLRTDNNFIPDLKLDENKNGSVDPEKRDNYNLSSEPMVIVELITANLNNDVTNYYLELQSNQLRSTDWVMGTPVGYITSNNFIGVVHYEEGYEILVQKRYKDHWYSSWKNYGSTYWVGKYYLQYWLYYNLGDYYRRGLVVYPCLYQQYTNYFIAYSNEEFRGNECAIGSWDNRNCCVGTPPSGTTAFMYPNNHGNFYYTPVNGNQCPRPGSYFDGNNCFVISIPSSTWGFIYNNKWYVKGEKILD